MSSIHRNLNPFCFQDQITAYVEYFGQFTSEQFPEDIAEVFGLYFGFWNYCLENAMFVGVSNKY